MRVHTALRALARDRAVTRWRSEGGGISALRSILAAEAAAVGVEPLDAREVYVDETRSDRMF